MNKKFLSTIKFFSLALLAAAFTACTDTATGNMGSHRLTIKADIEQSSRAIKDQGKFEESDEIGVTLVNGTNNTYYGSSYYNQCFTTTDGEEFHPSKDIDITSQGTVYAYYPYSGTVTDITQVPVTAGETDYMYATPVTVPLDGGADISLSFKHTMACIRLHVNKGYYSGVGNITSLEVSSPSLAVSGTLDVKTGTTTATDNDNTYTESMSYQLSDDTWSKDILVVPTGVEGEVNIKIVVDNEDYYVTSSSVKLLPGTIYEYTVNVEPLTWNNASNGVYAVSADGAPVDVADADESCIAVALVVGEHKFWIEKNETNNTTSIKAAYTEDGASNTSYKYFYWGMYGSDNTSITNYTQTGGGGTSSYGYLPKADGTYQSTPNLSGDYTTWTSGALSDFNGKENTAALLAASDTDRYTTYANMATWCKTFNQTATENQGYTDWYIPACGQLSLMYLNVTDINAALTKIGGTTLNTSNYYWSSSEYSSTSGWRVNFFSGYVNDDYKAISYRVRFVRDIE